METTLLLKCLGMLGTVLSNCLSFANLPAVLNARRQGSLGDLNPFPFPFLCGNCFIWCIYACFKKDAFVFCGNCNGFLLALFYCTSAVSLMKTPQERQKVEGVLIVSLAIMGILGFVASLTNNQDILGAAATTIVFILFAAPLSTLRTVVNTKNSASISRPWCFLSIANCVVWLMYAMLLADVYIGLPNVFGLVCAFLQVCMMVVYPSNPAASPCLQQPLADSDEQMLADVECGASQG